MSEFWEKGSREREEHFELVKSETETFLLIPKP